MAGRVMNATAKSARMGDFFMKSTGSEYRIGYVCQFFQGRKEYLFDPAFVLELAVAPAILNTDICILDLLGEPCFKDLLTA